ncbi:MAG: beta-galactosidase GalA [Fimbriimonas sp.]|nr:beta-galactosidase GalA [Fimbriimonas sp.]
MLLRNILLSSLLATTVASYSAGSDGHIRTRFDDGWRFRLDPYPTLGGTSVTKWEWSAAKEVSDLKVPALPDELRSATWRPARIGRDVFRNRPGFAWYIADLGSSVRAANGAKRVLHFDSVDDNCEVFVNGRRLTTHTGWNNPFDVPLDEAWQEGGTNSVAVLVENTGGGGGIMGEVALRAVTKQDQVPAEARPGYRDGSWRAVHLPHDYLLESPFTRTAEAGHGSLTQNPAWYRKTFSIPKGDLGKSIWLEFDGVYRNSMLWLNGHELGFHSSGYIGFRHDIAPYLHYGGSNELAVHIDPREAEGWWYEGAGIYRHVWLNVADPVHITPNGVFVSSNIRNGVAALQIQTTVSNESARSQTWTVNSNIIGPDGKKVASIRSMAGATGKGQSTVSSAAIVKHPALWSIEKPQLYRLVTEVTKDGSVVDRTETPFGLRTIRYDANLGFFLNGKPVKLKGTCNHQDFIGVGTGMPDGLLEWRIKKLKEMGSNAYRCSHNPPAKELLDACDRLGMVVMDENRHLGNATGPKTPSGTPIDDFPELREMILRDRNHPSIVMWSMCNEEPLQGTPEGGKIFAAMENEVHRWDTTRPCSCAMNGSWGYGISLVEDLQGGNYDPRGYDAYHKKFPNQPFFGSETASAVSTRGEYVNDRVKGYVSAYDRNAPPWAQPAEVAWKAIADRPYVAGGFVWTGFDYKGEPTPYGWPCINSHFGIMDMCGFPKDSYYYYKAWWGDKPSIHVYPHWNWPGKEGQPIEVWVQSNCTEVELFLNGKSLGTKPVPPHEHVQWMVNYEPGSLVAKGYKGHKLIVSDKVETTGAPAAILLSTDRSNLMADNEDLTEVAVRVVDSKGRIVPYASNVIRFTVSGSGTLAGVGNGDPSSHEPDQATTRSAFHGLCMALVRGTATAGKINLTATAPGLKGASIALRSTASAEH